VLLPLALIIPALLATVLVAYGPYSGWASLPHGLAVIYLSRRLQWPLLAFAIILCLALLVLVISGKRRAWWLLALAPILTLLLHRFATDPMQRFLIAENPPFIAASEATSIHDDDSVVGLRFDGQWYAFSYASLYRSPVVMLADRGGRLLLMWSPYANAASAWEVGRDVPARQLEIVAMPANTLLAYNARRGEFINGLTGENQRGQKATGLGQPIQTIKTTWRDWRTAHPETLVMLTQPEPGEVLPTGPIRMAYPLPARLGGDSANQRVAVIRATPPALIPMDADLQLPANLKIEQTPILIVRDRSTGRLRAFDRRIDDLSPRYMPNVDPKRKGVAYVDSDTHAGWSAELAAIDGPAELRGRKLKEIVVTPDLYRGVVEFWYPDVKELPAQPAQ
jgi:hypothetical protein